MSELSPHDNLESKLDKYKSQLVELKNKLENAPDTLKTDLIADINSIETMLEKVKKQISQTEHIALDKWNDVEDDFKHAYSNISKAIKTAFSKTMN